MIVLHFQISCSNFFKHCRVCSLGTSIFNLSNVRRSFLLTDCHILHRFQFLEIGPGHYSSAVRCNLVEFFYHGHYFCLFKVTTGRNLVSFYGIWSNIFSQHSSRHFLSYFCVQLPCWLWFGIKTFLYNNCVLLF